MIVFKRYIAETVKYLVTSGVAYVVNKQVVRVVIGPLMLALVPHWRFTSHPRLGEP